MQVSNDITSITNEIYTRPSFISMAQQNLDKAVASGNVTYKTVDPHLAYVYVGNFFGYLKAIGIPTDYHPFIAYINQIKSPHDFNENKKTLILVDYSVITNIARLVY